MKITRRIKRSMQRSLKKVRQVKKFIAIALAAGVLQLGVIPASLAAPDPNALPVNGTSSWGSVTITPELITLLGGQGAIINWEQFSIGSNRTVTFDFNTINNAAILNKVSGGNISEIFGTIASQNGLNSRIILVNTNGIVFGGGAKINTPFFVASTFDVSDANFKAIINGETAGTPLLFSSTTNKGISFEAGNIKMNGQGAYFIAPMITLAPGVNLISNPSLNAGDYPLEFLAAKNVSIDTDGNNYFDISKFNADASNTIKIGSNSGTRTTLAAGNSWLSLIGGKVDVANTDISTNDALDINAISSFEDTTDGLLLKASKDNAINLDNTAANIDEALLVAGSVNISNTAINASGNYGDVLIAAANEGIQKSIEEVDEYGYYYTSSFNRNGKADASNAIAITNNSVIAAAGSAEIYGGKIAVDSSDITGNIADIRAGKTLQNSWGEEGYSDKTTADSTNSIDITNNSSIQGYTANVYGGKVNISKSDITTPYSYGFINIAAVNSIESEDNYKDNSSVNSFNADSKNMLNVAESVLNNAYDINLYGGQTQITDSNIASSNSVDGITLNFAEENFKYNPDSSIIETLSGKGTKDNSLTISGSTITSGEVVLEAGAVNISGSAADKIEATNGLADVIALQNYTGTYSDDTENYTVSAATDNAVKIDGISMAAAGQLGISGGTIDVANSLINAGDYLSIEAKNTFTDAASGRVLNTVTGNNVKLTNTNITSSAGGIGIFGGKAQITNSSLTSTGWHLGGATEIPTVDIHIVAANSLNAGESLRDAEFSAGTGNTVVIDGTSTLTNNNHIRAFGGAITIGEGTTIDAGHGVGLAALTTMDLDQRGTEENNIANDSYFNGETTFSSSTGNNVVLAEGSNLNAGAGVDVLGSKITAAGNITAGGIGLQATEKMVNSEETSSKAGTQTLNFTSANVLEIGANANITSTSTDAKEGIMLLGGIVNNEGTLNAPNGSASVIGTLEMTNTGTINANSANTIKFSGTDYTENTTTPEGINVTVNGEAPYTKATINSTWLEDSDTMTITLTSVLAPADITDATPVEEVILAVDEAISNVASPTEALQVIEDIFTNIQEKSDADKAEIAGHVVETAVANGLDLTDVAKAIIDGDGGAGTADKMVAEASKEVSKETDPKNNSSESSNNPDAGTSTPANDNRTPQIAPERAEVETDTDTTGTVYGVFLEGERIDTEVTTAETAISESENAE